MREDSNKKTLKRTQEYQREVQEVALGVKLQWLICLFFPARG